MLTPAGEPVAVSRVQPSVPDQPIVVRGRLPRIAAVLDEELMEGDTVGALDEFIRCLQHSPRKADVFTVAEKVPQVTPRYDFTIAWDNAAVIPVTSVEDWERRVEADVRKALRRAKRLGVVVRAVDFDDGFVEGISRIYNESPFRRGLPFPHYGKHFDTVKRENSTYFDRSTYLGAYVGTELIGFIRWIQVGTVARTLQVIGMTQHFDKKSVNAMIAKAVELCEQRQLSHFVYGSYVYNDPSSSLTEFKRRNGFEQMLLPRYYVPLTTLGHAALALGLHRSLAQKIPGPTRARLLSIRSEWYKLKQRIGTHLPSSA